MNINTVCLGLPLWLSGKEPACNAGAAGSIPWKKARLPTRLPSILAQKIPWTEVPGGLQSIGLQKESDTTEHNVVYLPSESANYHQLTTVLSE